MKRAWRGAVAAVMVIGSGITAQAYPTDEYERTGIRRLKWQHDVDTGARKGRKLPAGAHWTGEQIQLRMTGAGRDYQLTAETPKDAELQQGLEAILARNAFKRYNVAVLDITDPARPRFAGVNENDGQTPGSVAKVLVTTGMLLQLAKRFPNDIAKREALLKSTQVTADDWSISDSHEVPVVSGPNLETISYKRVRVGDTFTLWEWMDHAMSASNNSAASMLWREATLMSLLPEYPPAKWDAELFKQWDRDKLSEASFAIITDPVAAAGLNLEAFNVYMYFTTHANRYIRAKSSVATPLGIVQWVLKMEQGKLVDQWSSRELKKMLYLTRRRVRYAQAPELTDSAIFFKSGSLYQCKPEEGFTCIQYQGNVVNVLNALVEVETPDVPAAPPPPAEVVGPPSPPPAEPAAPAAAPPPAVVEPPPLPPGVPKSGKKHVYIVAVMSNELKRNAASDHGKLAGELHRLIVGE